MDESFSVLIPDGESVYALLALHCFARFPKVRVYVLSRHRWAPARFSRYQRGYVFKETNSEDGSLLETVAGMIKREKIDALLPVDSNGISFAISNREALSPLVKIVPLPDRKSFETANNKWLMAQYLEANQIPGPPTALATDGDVFQEKLKDFEFPVLLKPVSAGGGRGIVRFDDLSALSRYIRQQKPETLSGKFVVQSIVKGYDLDLNILSNEGRFLAMSVQQGIIPGAGRYSPADAIRFLENQDFFKAAEKLTSVFAWSGFVHVDTVCDSHHSLRVIDMNARLWGSLRGSLEAGISFPYLACLTALGISYPLPAYRPIRYFHPKTALREGWAGLFGKNNERGITFAESGFRFLFSDPIAEALRVYRQSHHNPDQ